MLGLGLDMIDIARIRRALTNERFLQRVYTEAERARIRERGAQTAAGYFAAKEAVAKALGTGFRGFCIWDIEIVPDALGRPEALLLRGARERLEAIGGRAIHLSITHTDQVAAAVAIIE